VLIVVFGWPVKYHFFYYNEMIKGAAKVVSQCAEPNNKCAMVKNRIPNSAQIHVPKEI